MTTTAEQTEQAKAEAKQKRDEAMAKREAELNATKSGKGLRTFLGMTRGKGSTEIQYENWDVEGQYGKDSLPTTLSEVMDALKSRGVSDGDMEAEVVRRCLLGDNELLYKEASDPVAEFVEANWSDEIKKSFRTVVRNYAANTGVSIEDAAGLVKPAYIKAQAKLDADKASQSPTA